ncbi:TolB family protein [Arenimonas sp.]|uniref:TolB family protein n=1 Tax=Arenimonas sp. TaxID=1872635 RepID=UPI0039E2FC9E
MRPLPALALLLLMSPAAKADDLDPRFAPIEFLVGHCWRASFSDTQRDLQCFESLYGGKLIGNSHMVQGSDPLYQGQTIFSWDDANKRIRFHYFTSTGAVSEGYFQQTPDGIMVPERHVGADGKVTEMQNWFLPEGDHAYRVVAREKTADGWTERRNFRYLRTDSAELQKEKAAVMHEGAEWRLVWSSRRDGNYEVYRQEADGREVNLTKRASNEWAWNTRGDMVLTLSNERRGEEAKGWRASRLQGDALHRISDDLVSDGFADCHPDGRRCAAEVMADGRKRIAFFDASGKRVGILANDGQGDDADPQWSPDGKRLLFRSNRSGHWELHAGDAEGENPKLLTSDSANDALSKHEYGGEGPAHWSYDGKRIVWMRKFPGSDYDVWVMDADGGNPGNLTASHKGNDGYPSFSPDGRQIAFDSNREGANEIYLMDADGGNVRRITISPGGNLAPMWVRMPGATP